MNDHTAYNLAKLALIVMGIQLCILTYVFYTNYKGRQEIVHFVRLGCERNKKDANANASGWRTAEDARRASGELAVADRYATLASELEERGSTNCVKAFPKARLIP